MLIPFLRTILLFGAIYLSLRFLGKRQVGEMEPSEFVVTVLISELAAIPMQDLDIPLLHGIIPVVVLVLLEMIVSLVCLRFRGIRTFLAGKPEFVVVNGKISESALRRARITLEELVTELRQMGEHDIGGLKYVILETSGQLSVVKGNPEEEYFRILIADGEINRNNLRALGRSEEWLEQFAVEHKTRVEDIFYLAVGDKGTINWQKTEEAEG